VKELPSLPGERVLLRPLRREDLTRLDDIQGEPEVMRWWGPPAGAHRDEARTFAIELDGDLVGLIEYHEEDEPEFKHAGIDLFLTTAVHRRGLGTDAVRTLARWLIAERGHHRLTIDPAADNAGAIGAYAKVGFRPVGRMREYWRDPDGVWRDGLLMDLLARELR
jgi:aminoglycoside 6'-N-acetyltransferase